MKKKNTKTISGVLSATTILTSVVGATSVFAKGTDWNLIYKKAYEAMQMASIEKTQKSINTARQAINELIKNKNLISMGSTLSEQVDKVQQELFNDFYDLMYVDGKKKKRMSQDEINMARVYVRDFDTYKGNKVYTKSWSSAIDDFQQKNINETTEAVKKAEKTKNTKDIEKAKVLVKELLTSNNSDTKNWAINLGKNIATLERDNKVDENKASQKEIQKKIEQTAKKALEEITGLKLDNLDLNDKEAIETKINDVKKIINKISDEDVKKDLTNKMNKIEKILDNRFDDLENENSKTEVEKVFSVNNKEIVVNFNKKIDKESAETINNYNLIEKNYNTSATIGLDSKVELLKDGKTVIITLQKAAKNQDKAKLEITNVKDLKGNIINKNEKEFTFFDTTVPLVKDVKVVGQREIEVEFSEPMKEQPNIKLDILKQSSIVDFKKGTKKVTVVTKDELTEGIHKLTVEGGSDYAGYSIVKKVEVFNYKKSTENIDAYIIKANQDTATIKFSKPVKIKNISKVSVYHTYNNSKYYQGKIIAKDDINGYSDLYEIKFEVPMAEGNNKLFINTEKGALQDRWGNDFRNIELSAMVKVDKTVPKVLDIISEKDNEIFIKFNKEILEKDAINKDNYILKNSDGKILNNKDYSFLTKEGKFDSTVKINYDYKKYAVKVELPESLREGKFNLNITGIRDTSYDKNKLQEQEVEFSIKDTTPPTIVSAIKNDRKVRIMFSEPMNNKGLDDLNNYEFLKNDGKSLTLNKDASVNIIDNKTVEIDCVEDIKNIKIVKVSGNLKDLQGNKIKGVSISKEIINDEIIYDKKNQEQSNIKDYTVVTRSTSTIEFEINQELKGNLESKNFKVNNKEVAEANYINKDGKSKVILTLRDGDKFEPDTKEVVTIEAKALTNSFGGQNTEVIKLIAEDGIVPAIAKIKDSKGNEVDDIELINGKVQLKFTEAIKKESVSTETFAIEGFYVDKFNFKDNKTIELDFKSSPDKKNELTSGLTLIQKSPITDINGNKMENFKGIILEK